jgi:hypothetical protein
VFVLVAGKAPRPVGAELRGTRSRVWRGMASGAPKGLGFFLDRRLRFASDRALRVPSGSYSCPLSLGSGEIGGMGESPPVDYNA